MTTKEAALYLGISPTYLRNLRHLMHTDSGPKYEMRKHERGLAAFYRKEDLDSWAKSKSGKFKPVLQLDLNGCLIREWKGAKVASKELDIQLQAIYDCIRGRIKQSGGFIWRKKYAKFD